MVIAALQPTGGVGMLAGRTAQLEPRRRKCEADMTRTRADEMPLLRPTSRMGVDWTANRWRVAPRVRRLSPHRKAIPRRSYHRLGLFNPSADRKHHDLLRNWSRPI